MDDRENERKKNCSILISVEMEITLFSQMYYKADNNLIGFNYIWLP